MKNHVKKILEYGYTKIPNVISPKECDNLKKLGKNIFFKFKHKTKVKNPLEETIYNLHNKNVCFLKYLDNNKIIKIVKKCLSAGSYKNNCDIILRQTAMRNPKKGFAQQLHNDTRVSGCNFPLAIHVIYMLDDFTKYNGATRVVPKSQKRLDFAKDKKKYKNEKLLIGKKGDAIIFDASIWHGSSEKLNNIDRWGMIFSYSRWFLKPDYNFNKNTPKKIFDKLSINQKRIMGFNFNPPKDEFERSSAISEIIEKPDNYKLPR